MSRTMTVSDSITIDGVTPAEVYAQVSDPTLMGRWSPENTGATLESPQDGAVEAYEGMMFDGTNKRGRAAWTTRCRVTAADPGRAFAFRVEAIGLTTPRLRRPIATWRYGFEETDSGTRVTETWMDARTGWPDPVAAVFDRIVTRGNSFADHQRGNIARTLGRLKDALEGPGSSN